MPKPSPALTPRSQTAELGLGLRNPTIELLLPLSRRMVACARWSGPNSYGTLVEGMAEMINERTLRAARRFVFASERSEELLAVAVRLRETGPKIRTRRIPSGQGLIIVSEFL